MRAEESLRRRTGSGAGMRGIAEVQMTASLWHNFPGYH